MMERDFDEDGNEVNYFLRLTLQDADNQATRLYMTGFNEAGEDLFERDAKALSFDGRTRNR